MGFITTKRTAPLAFSGYACDSDQVQILVTLTFWDAALPGSNSKLPVLGCKNSKYSEFWFLISKLIRTGTIQVGTKDKVTESPCVFNAGWTITFESESLLLGMRREEGGKEEGGRGREEGEGGRRREEEGGSWRQKKAKLCFFRS
jgi:hypothetical protein